jgi:chitinase
MNLQVNLVSTQSWIGGGNGSITITNLGTALSNWSFQLQTPNVTIQSFWSLSKEGTGSIITVKPAYWKLSLNAGEVIQSGFAYTGPSIFNATTTTSGVKITSGAPITVTPPAPILNFEISLSSTQAWDGGGNGLISIKNLGSDMTNWSFQLQTTGYTIQSFWALSNGGSGSNITVKPAYWKTTIASGETAQSGFAYTGVLGSTTTTTSGVKIVNTTPTTPPPTTPPPTTPPPTTPPLTTPPPTTTTKKVIGYFTEWSIYQRQYSVSLIPASKLTHVLYAFMLPNPNQDDYNLLAANYAFPPKPYDSTVTEGTLVFQDGYAGPLNIQNLKNLKIQYPNLKVLISVGGWTMSWTLSKVFANDTLRNTFITSAVKFIIDNGFDGLDIDWENPGVQGIGFNYVDAVNDTPNLIKFLSQLRQAFDTASPNKHMEITAAIGTNPNVINHYNGTAPYLDYVNAMTYDYAGSWGDGGHLAGLYHNPKGDMDPQFNVDSAITNLINAGFTADKIVLGLPFYARGWAKIIPTDLSNPIFGKNIGGPGVSYSLSAGEPGLSSWRNLRDIVGTNGMTRYYDSVAHAAYIYNSTTGEAWSYDDPSTIKEKVQYMKNRGLAGIMGWELSDDTRDGKDSLLDAAISQL